MQMETLVVQKRLSTKRVTRFEKG